MKEPTSNIIRFVPVFALFLLLLSCSSAVNLNADLKDYSIHLYLKEYTPKFTGVKQEFKGTKICLANIRNDARNTTNFSYHSRDNKVQYLLSNRVNTHIQLIPSFFWYAYQKAFEHAGIETLPRCEKDMPELWIVFLSFNDEELRFKITLYENRETIFEKEMKINMPPVQERNPVVLQTRGYEMIDLTIKTILDDSGFQAAFF
jgi:hypothetical protein